MNHLSVFVLVYIALRFRELTTAEKVLARLRLHIQMLTGNTHFPVIDPTLVALENKADQLQLCIDKAKGGSHLLIEKRNIVSEEAMEMIRLLAYDIQKKSGGDMEKIHSAGFYTRKPKASTIACGKMLITGIQPMKNHRIKLSWRKEAPATVYLIEISTDPNGKIWHLAGKSINLSISIDGYKLHGDYVFLNPGTKYRFRIYAWNQLGDGAYSEVAEMICV